MTTLKSLIAKLFQCATKEDSYDTIYVIEDGKVREELVEIDPRNDELFSKAGRTTEDTPGGTAIIAIECADSGDLFYMQISGDGNVAVVTQHERDYMNSFNDDVEDGDMDRGVNVIDDVELTSTIVDEENNAVMLSLIDLTPRSGYSLLSLVGKVLQILIYQRNVEEGLL